MNMILLLVIADLVSVLLLLGNAEALAWERGRKKGRHEGMEEAASYVETRFYDRSATATAIRTLEKGGVPCEDCGYPLPEHDSSCVSKWVGRFDMMLMRRQFLQSCLALAAAPAIVRASSLMPLVRPRRFTLSAAFTESAIAPLYYADMKDVVEHKRLMSRFVTSYKYEVPRRR